MADEFSFHRRGLESPASHAAAVTPNDSADLATVARALYVGTGGNIKVTTVGGDDVTFASVPGGFVLPVSVRRVWSSSTTASNIHALW